MARRRLSQRSILINVGMWLRPGRDDDLIEFFRVIPRMKRALVVKASLRSGGMQAQLASIESDDGAMTDDLVDGLVF